MSTQCPVMIYQNVSPAAWTAILTQANQALQPLGIGPIAGNAGSQSHEGVTVTWVYNPTPGQNDCGHLTITVTVSDFLAFIKSAQEICDQAAQYFNFISGLIAANPCS